MFRGAAKVTLDAKGRMVLPTRYRDVAFERSEGKLVATVDRDQCLLLYPLPDWEQIERKLMSLPSLHAQARRLQRLMRSEERRVGKESRDGEPPHGSRNRRRG